MKRRSLLRALLATALVPVTRPVFSAGSDESTVPAETIVLVHGLWMTGMETGLMRSRFTEDYGFATRQYSYHTVQVGLEDNIRLLHDFIQDVPGETVHVVGHSLGGLLAIHTATRFPGSRKGRIVCLGSPLRGSAAARALASLPFGEDLLGVTMREAVLAGGLTEYHGAREVGVIAGTLTMGLGAVIENLPTPNDGTVAVAETQIPGIKDHLELSVSHTGMLMSEVVVSQTAYFLRHGEFARPGTPPTAS